MTDPIVRPLSELPTEQLIRELFKRVPRGCAIFMLEPPMDAQTPGNKVNFAAAHQFDSKDSFCRMKGHIDWWFTMESIGYHNRAVQDGDDDILNPDPADTPEFPPQE